MTLLRLSRERDEAPIVTEACDRVQLAHALRRPWSFHFAKIDFVQQSRERDEAPIAAESLRSIGPCLKMSLGKCEE
ncbi:hypothetical protein TNCV_662431 [Trichonephila clavipes]|nr:hypothetical protein TNCV_662431 [Trichonephila clavipes]